MEGAWTRLSSLPEWCDVVPAPTASDGPQVVAIHYDAQSDEVLRYFRAIYESGEVSERALRLSEMAIEVNPAHYTAWQRRWELLQAMGQDLSQEMMYLDRVAAEHPKNYQLWNHRRKCVLALGRERARQELLSCAQVLLLDSKNYHVWAHRQALVAAFGLWQEELSFVGAMLQQDLRNNSAWNQRAFVLRNGPASIGAAGSRAEGGGSPGDAGVGGGAGGGGGRAPLVWGAGLAGGWLGQQAFEEELQLCMPLIKQVPHNEAGWAYLSGLLHARGWHEALCFDPRIQEVCEEVLACAPSCPFALGLLLEVYHAQAGVASQQGQREVAREAARCGEMVHQALQVADPMRRGYWRMRAAAIGCVANGTEGT